MHVSNYDSSKSCFVEAKYAHHGVPNEADALEVAERRLQALHLRHQPLAAPNDRVNVVSVRFTFRK